MSWEMLTESYSKSGIVLALGSGVSVQSKLPNWPQLLERMASEFKAIGRRVDYDKLVGQRLPLPVIASVFEEYSGGRKELVERVRRALYKEFPFYPQGVSKGNRSRLVRLVQEQNPTLHAVATVCAVRSGMDRFIANPRVRAIVTFNMDALLQAYIYARFEKRLVRTIERASASSMPSKIPVYHMHGLLRFDSKAGDPQKECADVVLTEQDYFDFFNDPTRLFNYTFLYLLREATCLFVGLSMQDENIRRMLHLSKKERVSAWIREGISCDEARRRSLRHFAILKHSADVFVDEAIKDSLVPLGTQVLWVDEFEEIPGRLRAMYESTGHPWSAVR